MARKNLLATVTGAETPKADVAARHDYALRGASRSMMLSIDEMAENAKKMLAGETVVELDVSVLDRSFVADRIEDDDADFADLREAIREHGQSTPILVRPHPQSKGRFMIVFGHRRARVAKELGIPVRAVIKNLEDIAHIIAQGQENTARANLSFIEKALFAKKLLDMGQRKETIKSALTIDDSLLSRMLSVVETVPAPVIEAIGAAKTIGRDRWEELKKQVKSPKAAEAAIVVVASDEFRSKDVMERFNFLLAQLQTLGRKARKSARGNIDPASWESEGKTVSASYRNNGSSFNLSLKSKEAGEFGRYISSNLDALYRAFKETKIISESGD
ncbi:plasmid partitioning protein RepB [Methylosinus sp. KRF6]|uniref:plasmid partitioning protein RepB n=1 Tax=Methylosinus sp. KRF6 TaxID=2846853 RepID=UPI001C0B2832|nr:plasmid partitioning protein RepB [Methylosinus sp. KRF6]MBU3888050.1 plasmid partitioning protein RepB [Methylosinus sp. KRF6]